MNIEKDIVNDRNIVSEHLKGKGYHINPYGNARITLNFNAIKKNYEEILTIHKILDNTMTLFLKMLLNTDACLFRENK